MLYKAKTLMGYKLKCLDGEFGNVKDFYFDDRHWVVRYLVAGTGDWLISRQVLISPYALAGVRKDEQQIVIDLTKKQIEDSPSLDTDEPVSRQFEADYYMYYGWPIYWGGSDVWGSYPFMWGSTPDALRDTERGRGSTQEDKQWNPHMRSAQEVIGYHIHATDGEIGHIEDFIIDDKAWAIRYLIVDTRNWWPGKRVLISPRLIERVSWEEAQAFVNLRRETIEASPEYTEETLLTQDYETAAFADALHGVHRE